MADSHAKQMAALQFKCNEEIRILRLENEQLRAKLRENDKLHGELVKELDQKMKDLTENNRQFHSANSASAVAQALSLSEFRHEERRPSITTSMNEKIGEIRAELDIVKLQATKEAEKLRKQYDQEIVNLRSLQENVFDPSL